MYESTRAVWSEFWAKKLLQKANIVIVDSAVTHLQLMEDPSLSSTIELLDQVVAGHGGSAPARG
jgi:hypothetical protein